ncbi:MAG: hypothetical protein Q7L07_11605 [Pseudohongiella sp.]|nr:hypothetical protein [Pseudohongiella sp.]
MRFNVIDGVLPQITAKPIAGVDLTLDVNGIIQKQMNPKKMEIKTFQVGNL